MTSMEKSTFVDNGWALAPRTANARRAFWYSDFICGIRLIAAITPYANFLDKRPSFCIDLTSAKESVVRLINSPKPAKLKNLLSMLSPDWVDATVTVPNSDSCKSPQISPLMKMPNPIIARGPKIFNARHQIAGFVPIISRAIDVPNTHILTVNE